MSNYDYHFDPKYPRVVRLKENKLGRTFFLTDPHGAYTTVGIAMKTLAFDPEVDLIIGGGDYFDRGSDSYRSGKFLALKYVKGVRGNHCQALIDLYANGEPSEAVLQWAAKHNGFGWWLTTPRNVRQEILHEVRKLPLIIEVETARGLVGIVHADIPKGMDWQTFVNAVEADDQTAIHTALWGRQRIAAIDDRGHTVNDGKPNYDGVRGIDRVFVGHTPQWGGVRQFGNIFACDLGAIAGETGAKKEGMLGVIEITCATQVITARRPISLVDIRADNPFAPPKEINKTPFGKYWA